MPDMRPGIMATTPLRWTVEVLLRGNLLLSQEKEFKAWVSTRGGVLKRTMEAHEDIVWYATFMSLGANALLVFDWVARKLREIMPGDRLDRVKIGVVRIN
jgi:hypothetical protein